MFGYKASLVAIGIAASALALLGTPASGEDNPLARHDIVRIGLVHSLFRDTPDVMVQVIMEPFSALMESQTGIKGQLSGTHYREMPPTCQQELEPIRFNSHRGQSLVV